MDTHGRELIFDHTLGNEESRPGQGVKRGRTFRENVTGIVLFGDKWPVRLGPEPTVPVHPFTIDTESIINNPTTEVDKPSDWNDADNQVEVLGGGAGAGNGDGSAGASGGGAGGGAGAWSSNDNWPWGADPETVSIGGAVSQGTNGVDTNYKDTGSLLAKGGILGSSGGPGATGGSGGPGGASGSGVGDNKFSGGAGGDGGTGAADAGGGGGGGGGAGGDENSTRVGGDGAAGGNYGAGGGAGAGSGDQAGGGGTGAGGIAGVLILTWTPGGAPVWVQVTHRIRDNLGALTEPL